jgi:hypothetical protein
MKMLLDVIVFVIPAAVLVIGLIVLGLLAVNLRAHDGHSKERNHETFP